MSDAVVIQRRWPENPAVFRTRFRRCRELLYFIASRILGAGDAAQYAVDRCWLAASRNPPLFESEGAFRSWLVRILIDEALAVQSAGEEPAEDALWACG